ncbi:hypothetical protein DACRYDRAFT_22333 [Dacryopinax primogenitus]|uniref:DH domain-containing protein n=1 Tax=Dacryopinax primogenitus (strain DJM 731) TaxID=1858805 RepID=M5G149_DACPD|nr:uncharacterized protein DACRYDRAFT_22333 [Dacryopinax primogenitus]EJU01895.1 hypothetical protein DACRYDRAFT_22333 [Dacryopinax primogenitus]
MASSTSTGPRPDKPIKKSNPLIDLIDTEKQYVDLLASIIRRVAAAWSKENFPPRQLDTMFRCVEAIYKANRSLLARLKDIGPNPSSPKALGDLLMRWIDDLEDPYERYCSSYLAGFDHWPLVQQNNKLPRMLAEVSAATPPGQSSGSPVDGEPDVWSLDSLFLLPRGRLKYYKRLYSRLLKSTQPGRSDHRLLVVAVEKLDGLLETVAARLRVLVEEPEDSSHPPLSVSTDEQVASEIPLLLESQGLQHQLPTTAAFVGQADDNLDEGSAFILTANHHHLEQTSVPKLDAVQGDVLVGQSADLVQLDPATERLQSSLTGGRNELGIAGALIEERTTQDTVPLSRSSSPVRTTTDADIVQRGSSSSGTITGSQSDDRSSRSTGSTSLGPLGGLPSPAELERGLSVDQVLDIFSMKPKACSLQLNPPDLPFVRSTRTSLDVIICCTPIATGVEAKTERGHIYLLSDLLLLCERPPDGDSLGGRSMRLLYPPLAGRFIRLLKQHEGESESNGNTVNAQLLRKINITFRTDSQPTRDKLLRDLEDCIDLASNLPANRSSKTQSSTSHPPPSAIVGSTSLTRSTSEPLGQVEFGVRGRSPDPPRPFMPIMGPATAHNSLPPVPVPIISQRTPHSMAYAPNQQNNRQFPPRDASLTTPVWPMQMPLNGQSIVTSHPSMVRVGPQSFPPQHHPQYGNVSSNAEGVFARRDDAGRLLIPHPGEPSMQSFNGRPEKPLPPYGYGTGPTHVPLPPDMARPYIDPAAFPSPTASVVIPPSSRSTVLSSRSPSLASSHPSVRQAVDDISPPSSPGEETKQLTAVISAQMKCKVFLKQAHAQWKSLGGGKLKLYQQQPTNVKQLVVEADTKEKTLLISTIILTDAVERVGKTGVAIELSDKGASTGIVYMIQLRNEASATGLFNSLLAGSDRTTSG